MQDIFIVKKNGDQEIFDGSKLERSLKKSQATDAEIESVLYFVQSKIRNGMHTDDIFNLAHRTLKSYQKKNPNAIRYSLKQSIMDLGPSGFPFELFVARIFAELGYTCKTGVMVQGNCIQHEVDVLAHKDKEVICIEAKFHNEPYLKSDTKVALYVKSRFDDLIGQKITIDDEVVHITRGILITNTNFTDSAHDYVNCVGTYDLISWNKPDKDSLLDYIETHSLYPITVISELSKREITSMLEQGIIMCRDIKRDKNIMNKLGIKNSRQQTILDTINAICKC